MGKGVRARATKTGSSAQVTRRGGMACGWILRTYPLVSPWTRASAACLKKGGAGGKTRGRAGGRSISQGGGSWVGRLRSLSRRGARLGHLGTTASGCCSGERGWSVFRTLRSRSVSLSPPPSSLSLLSLSFSLLAFMLDMSLCQEPLRMHTLHAYVTHTSHLPFPTRKPSPITSHPHHTRRRNTAYWPSI